MTCHAHCNLQANIINQVYEMNDTLLRMYTNVPTYILFAVFKIAQSLIIVLPNTLHLYKNSVLYKISGIKCNFS